MTRMDASKTQKTSCIEWVPQLAIMRIVACIAIVVLHTVFAANEYFINEITNSQNLLSRIVENNMMWAVPIFLMVTGVLHLDNRKTLPLKKLYKKYIFRVTVALCFFSVLFRLFDMIMDGEDTTFKGVFKAFFEMITSTNWGHLWYLYLLIGLYVLMPFYKKVSEACSDIELLYLMAVYCVFFSLVPLIESFGINIGFYISESLIYPLFLFLGHMIHEKRFFGTKKMGAALLFITTVAISLLTVLKYNADITISSVFFGYQSPLVIIQSIGVFMLVDNNDFNTQTEQKRKVITCADGMTFGIYLIHMMFVRLLFKYMQVNPYNYLAPITMAICIACIFVISYFLVAVLKRIPVLRLFL